MIIVTGGAGFIGSNLVHELNRRGRDDILVVDDLTDGTKFANLAGADIADYLDKDDFRRRFLNGDGAFAAAECVYHLGACSVTTEWDGKMMLDVNYAYARDLIDYCDVRSIPVVYASSASVYGGASSFTETRANEKPLNVYAYSKCLLDSYVRRRLPAARSHIVGLRYFNVYGPREQHKQSMASVAYHFNRQVVESGAVRLFEGSHGFAAGEQQRDFVHVADVVNATLWFGDHAQRSGIYNCGTGRAETFNAVANAVIAWHGRGEIEYVPFPGHLLDAYQSFTEADLVNLRASGCDVEFLTVAEGVKSYLDWLND